MFIRLIRWIIRTRPRQAAVRRSHRTGARPTGPALQARQGPTAISGRCWVIDGDTIIINKTRIRLAGIDAPEMDQPWGHKAKWALVALCRGQIVTAHLHDEMSYNRHVATCYLADGRDLSEEMVKCGLAIDWRRHSRGKYRGFEPEGIRRLLWRQHYRQMPPTQNDNAAWPRPPAGGPRA